MKIKNRFDRVLKMLTVFAMTLSCFTDMPIRVVAESFDVDSVISIESHNNGTDANDSEASLAVSVTVNGQTVTAPKSVAPGTLTVRANEGYEIDSMILDGTEFNESTDVQAGEHSLNITAHSTASQSNESEEIQQPDPTVEPTPTITPDSTPEVTATPEVTVTPDTTPTPTPEVTKEPTQVTPQIGNSIIQNIEGDDVYLLTIYYVYGEDAAPEIANTTAQATYYAEVISGNEYKVASKEIQGYSASQNLVSGIMPSEDLTITITYHPTETAYTVNHKFMQLDGSLVTESETMYGKFGTETQAVARQVNGFEAGVIENTLISTNTIVEIEYTRINYTVRFDSDGGNYISAVEAPFETIVDLSAKVPTKAGYDFAGWYNGDSKVEGSVSLTENITLTAHWALKANQKADYQVIFWVEKADSEDYDFLYSQTVYNAQVGSEIKNYPTFNSSKLSAIGLNPAGFKTPVMETGKTVALDGSTVLNVRINRKVFSLSFYNNWQLEKTITKKYGANITAQWPSGNLWREGSQYWTGMQQMPAEDKTLYKVNSSGKTYSLHYMVESLKDSSTYDEHHVDSYEYRSSMTLSDEDCYPIEGYKFVKSNPKAGQTIRDKAYIYYSRNSYTLSYDANGGKNAPISKSIKYEEVLPETETIPTKEGYEFTGWYYDPGAQEKVNFGKDKMPAHNTVLYAGWAVKTYEVKFDLNYDGGIDFIVNANYNSPVKIPDAPERDGYTFLGWSITSETLVKYDFGTPIKDNITLYAHWQAKNYTSYNIRYLLEGTDTELADSVKVDNQRVGKTITVFAKSIENYIPVLSSQSLTLKQTDNEIIFYYSQAKERGYTIIAMDISDPEKPVELIRNEDNKTDRATVIIDAPSINDYILADGETARKTLMVSDNETENIVTFNYVKRSVGYTVNYYKDSTDESNLLKSETGTGKIGTTIPYENGKYLPNGYVAPGTVTGPEKITNIAANNVINIIYAEDANVTINYEATTGGSVDRSSESLAPATGEAQGSTATASAGYHFVNWTNAEGTEVSTDAHFTPEKVDGLNVAATYTANFAVNSYNYKVSHVYRDADNNVVEELTTTAADEKRNYLSAIAESPRGPENANGNFVLSNIEVDSVDESTLQADEEGNITGTMPAENLTITFYYDADNIGEKDPEEGDGIADKYQITVTYDAVNGKVVANQGPFVLTKYNANHEYAMDGVAYLAENQIATVESNSGYHLVSWAPKEPTTEIALNEDTEFVATFAINEYQATVKYIDEETKAEIGTAKEVTAKHGDTINGEDYKIDIEDYVYTHAESKAITEAGMIVNVYYSADKNHDEIPDKYQIHVNYNAVNGTITANQGPFTLNKVNENGEYAVDGIAHLSDDQIAKASPNNGYQGGTWSPMAPTTTLDLTEDITFTITFTANPADPDPVNPGCPAGTEWNEEAQACLAPVVPPVPVPPGPGPVNPEPQPEEEVIVEPTTPEGGGEVTPTPTPEVEEIEEPEQPQVGHKGSWALINLIASLLGLLAALFLIFAKHSKEDDDEEDQNQTVAMNEEEDPEQLKRKRIYKWISGLTAVISVIVFVLTENMRLPMVLVDKWTLLMVVFFLINAVTLYLGRRWHEDEDDEEQTQA